MKTKREVLLRAAELCEVGWVQGSAACSPGCDCAVTAINAAASDELLSIWCWNELADYLRLPCPESAGSAIIRWNDTPGRTKEEVVAALRAAAEKCQ